MVQPNSQASVLHLFLLGIQQHGLNDGHGELKLMKITFNVPCQGNLLIAIVVTLLNENVGWFCSGTYWYEQIVCCIGKIRLTERTIIREENATFLLHCFLSFRSKLSALQISKR